MPDDLASLRQHGLTDEQPTNVPDSGEPFPPCVIMGHVWGDQYPVAFCTDCGEPMPAAAPTYDETPEGTID